MMYAIWSREDPRFPVHREHGQSIQHLLQVWYYTDFIKRGVVLVLLFYYSSTLHSSVFLL